MTHFASTLASVNSQPDLQFCNANVDRKYKNIREYTFVASARFSISNFIIEEVFRGRRWDFLHRRYYMSLCFSRTIQFVSCLKRFRGQNAKPRKSGRNLEETETRLGSSLATFTELKTAPAIHVSEEVRKEIRDILFNIFLTSPFIAM